MTITQKTASEYAVEIENGIKARNDSYDTKVGAIPDLYINPVSNVLELQNERLRSIQQLLSLINDGSFTSSDIDDFVYNELMIRLGGSKSPATLVFSRSSPVTVDITVAAGFPVSTLRDEDTGTSITFVTTQDTTLVAANAASYLNNSTGKYELLVPAESTTASSQARVGANRIIKPLRPLNGFDSVFNRDAVTSGSDPETDDELIARYYLSLLGTSPTVETGIRKIIKTRYAQVEDANIVYGNNQYNVRAATDAGAIDVHIIGSTLATRTDTITFTGANQKLVLPYQPVTSVTSITGYVQGTDYTFIKDTSGYAGSIRATDGVQWRADAASMPAIGSSISVTYTYNSLVNTMQIGFTDPAIYELGSDLLYKEGTKKNIRLTANVKVLSGFSASTTISLLTSSLLQYVNSLLLGQDVEQSDLQLIARGLTSIDNFIITNLSIVGSTGVSDITIGGNEYARIDSSNLVLTVI